MYAAPIDLLTRFGADEIAELAFAPNQDGNIFPDNAGELLKLTLSGGDRGAWASDEQVAADEAKQRLEVAITDAANRINGYVSRVRTLPLSAEVIEESNLPLIQANIARYLLYDDGASEAVKEHFKDAIEWLKDVSKGNVSLGSQDEEEQEQEQASIGCSIVRQGNSRFNWDAY